MGKFFLNIFLLPKKPISLLVISVMCLELLGSVWLQVAFFSNTALADTAIDPAPLANAPSYTVAGSGTVFIDDLVGYKFSRLKTGECAYRKTTDGGDSWGSPVKVDSQTDCIGVSVWYDKWTPDDAGDLIHIAIMDTSDDYLFYNRLDTKTDTLLLSTATTTTPGSSASYLDAQNRVSITKATSGEIFMTADDDLESVVVSCASDCGKTSSWASAGTPPQANSQNTWSLLMPLSDGRVMLINRDLSNNIKSSIWNGSSWSVFTIIDNSPFNTTYDVGMSATLDVKTGDIFLAYTDNLNFSSSNHDLRTAVYSDEKWTKKTNVFTNISGKGLLQTAISFNQTTDEIYLAYTLRDVINSVSTADVFFVTSSDQMSTWSSSSVAINSSSGDLYGIDLNLMSYFRFFVSWFNNTNPKSIYGDTIATSSPEVLLRTLGQQENDVISGTDDFFTGGSFVLNSIATRTVSKIILTEKGSVNAETGLENVKLFYKKDTSSPYTCVGESLDGSEIQFGSTVVGGFSASDGIVTFNDSVEIGPEAGLCLFLVLDIKNTAADGETLSIAIDNPSEDVAVSGVDKVYPFSTLALENETLIKGPKLVQNAFHFRNDDGSEALATSKTNGNQNTEIEDIKNGENFRLRLGLANQGSYSTQSISYTLEYSSLDSLTCSEASGWQAVDSINSAFVTYDSSFFNHNDNTTDISLALGGVENGATNFLTSNSGVLETIPISNPLVLGSDDFTEFEYSLQASSYAQEGRSYCFRLVANSGEFVEVANFPILTMDSDLKLSVFGSLIDTVTASTSDVYAGGGFSIIERDSGRQIEEITLSEITDLDLNDSLKNLKLFYNIDNTSPYTCDDRPFNGTETQFGTTTPKFNPLTRSSTFSDNVSISTTSSLCLYVVYDISRITGSDHEIKFAISSPSDDVVANPVSSIKPMTAVTFSSSTLIEGEVLEQTGFHFRNDDGSETSASSATQGNENVPMVDFGANTPIRIRFGITNSGNVTTAPASFQIEFAKKITTCDLVSSWTKVGTGVEMWNLRDSSYLTNGEDATNILLADGGVTDSNLSFLSVNGGVRDTENSTAPIVLTKNNFTELEFSLISNPLIDKDTTFCFRVTANGEALTAYNYYPEITTVQKRDFFVQRGSTKLTSTSTKLTAGVDYVSPTNATKAFVRITNLDFTGAGNDSGGSSLNANNVTVYISDASDLSDSFTLSRPDTASGNTKVDWEILEFVGEDNTDNEIIVREVGVLSFLNQDIEKNSGVISGIKDDNDVLVFVTGVRNSNAGKSFYAGQVTSDWDKDNQKAVIKRGASGNTAIDVSYAVVEFTGLNWKVQRVEHTYSADGVTETENISAVNSLSKTFLHTQKRMGNQSTSVLNFGHEVWLSSIGAVSFRLESGADVTGMIQTSVAWVVENTQGGLKQMQVQRYSGNTSGGTAPLSLNVSLDNPVWSGSNTSISANGRASGANTNYPRPLAGFSLVDKNTFRVWRGDTGSTLTYRTEIIEWPVANLSLRQNFYRFYEDNDAKTPVTAWPSDSGSLGENTSITYDDNPPMVGDKLRLRINIKANNANLNADLQAFKIQYAERVTTCSAISSDNWGDMGGVTSTSSLWRGFSHTSTTNNEILSSNPPQGGDLLLSNSDKAGLLLHQNPTNLNPYTVYEGENVEYDWSLENYMAKSNTVYCFRIVKDDSASLEVYDFYPQIRTAPFTPVLKNWQWFFDVENKTPQNPAALEGVTPINILNRDQDLSLRVSLLETRGVLGENVKFKLQFSEDPSFTTVSDVVSTSTCALGSTWCYSEAGSVFDNETLDESILSDAEVCTQKTGDGCGTYNLSPNVGSSTHNHPALQKQEYSFNLVSSAARLNTVYYFRLFDTVNNLPVTISSSSPSLTIESANLVFSVSGLPENTSTAGIVTSIETKEDEIAFGKLLVDTDFVGAQRLNVDTNAFDGYEVLVFSDGPLIKTGGGIIPPVTGTNISPLGWIDSCSATSTGCFGYHTTDTILKNSSTRFALDDTYAELTNEPAEIMHSSIPTIDQYDIVYRLKVGKLQEAGDYETNITYLVVPSF